MRPIIYHVATSIDGFIADQNATIEGFLMEGPHADDFMSDLGNYRDVIMGGQTYAFGFQYGIEPGQPAYPGMVHHVVSGSFSFESSELVRLVAENPIVYIERLKQETSDAPIWLCGGGNLAGQLLNAGLVDELMVKVNPIVLSAGVSLFEQLDNKSQWEYIGTKSYENGVVLLKYKTPSKL